MGLLSIAKIKSTTINLLIILFLIHGSLYFLYPQDIYNYDSPIRFIKYICLILILCMVLKESNKAKVMIYVLIAISLISINIIAVGNNFTIVLVMNYVLPISIYFFSEGISKHIKTFKIASITYIIMSIFGYIEFFFLHGLFPRFADMGYRVLSIFVNPNNFGLVTVILTVFIYGKINNKIVKIILFINSLLLFFLSGSRNSMITFCVIVLLYSLIYMIKVLKNKKIKLKNILLAGMSSILLIILTVIFKSALFEIIQSLLLNTRSLKTSLFSGRFYQYEMFFNSITESIVFPYRNVLNYVDNLYLHLWGFYGLFILILFIFMNFYLVIKSLHEKKTQQFILLVAFLVMGLAENFLYLWPLAYFYWYLVASILKQPSRTVEN